MAKEGKIVISLDFSYGFDADLIFHSILKSKSKQVSLSQDCAHEAVTRNEKEANWRQEKGTAVMTPLWVFLSSHWRESDFCFFVWKGLSTGHLIVNNSEGMSLFLKHVRD